MSCQITFFGSLLLIFWLSLGSPFGKRERDCFANLPVTLDLKYFGRVLAQIMLSKRPTHTRGQNHTLVETSTFETSHRGATRATGCRWSWLKSSSVGNALEWSKSSTVCGHWEICRDWPRKFWMKSWSLFPVCCQQNSTHNLDDLLYPSNRTFGGSGRSTTWIGTEREGQTTFRLTCIYFLCL